MRCQICQSKRQKIKFNKCYDIEYKKGSQYDVFQCHNCGLVYIYPLPTIEQLLSFYPVNYHGYVESFSRLTNFLINAQLLLL